MADKDQEPTKKKSKKKLLIILLLLLAILGGGGYAAYHFFLKDMFFSGNATLFGGSSEPAGKTEEEAAPAPPTKVVAVDPFVVNLANPIGNKHIRLTMDLEMIDDAAVAQLKQEMVKVRDSIILLLCSKTYTDLAPIEGKLQLKNEIVERVNLILGGPKVVKVYFTDMIFQ